MPIRNSRSRSGSSAVAAIAVGSVCGCCRKVTVHL